LFALGVFAVCLAAGEVGVRVFGRLAHRERLYQLDPVAGYTCKPSLDHKVKQYGEHAFAYSTNARGFRVTAPPGAVREGKPIILLGDSFAFGYCVNDEDSLGFLLSEQTGRPVANLSAAGYSPDIYLPLLREHLQGSVPAEAGGHVVVLICDNDFTDLTQRYKDHRPKPYFERDGAGYRERPPQPGWLDHLMDSSDLAYLVLSHVLPATRPTGVPYEETPRLLCHILTQIQVVCAARDLPFTALFFEHLDKPQVSEGMREEFIALCREQGLNVPVITPEIRAESKDVGSLLAADRWHWSRRGNERVSQIIQRYLD
jgi:hypothetical protein